jgi:hypothetical protein
MCDLTMQLKHSVIRAYLQRLAFRIIKVEREVRTGVTGPRLLRYKKRWLEQERQRIEKMAQDWGIDTEPKWRN